MIDLNTLGGDYLILFERSSVRSEILVARMEHSGMRDMGFNDNIGLWRDFCFSAKIMTNLN